MRRNNRVLPIKLILGAGIVVFTLFKYWGSSEQNPWTGRKQHINIEPEQEIQLGLQSATKMAQQFGGLYPDQDLQNKIDAIGHKLVKNSIASETPYSYNFHLLRDPETVNAFALPGGQIFITYGLLKRLQNEDQLAGVIGHEIGHVVGRHSAERIAKENLTKGIVNGVLVGSDGNYSAAQTAAMVGNMVNMKYGRDDELESDALGVKFMINAGYNPAELIGVMKILEEDSGGQRVLEFQSSHPSPQNRVEKIKEVILKYENNSKSSLEH